MINNGETRLEFAVCKHSRYQLCSETANVHAEPADCAEANEHNIALTFIGIYALWKLICNSRNTINQIT